MPDWHWKKPGLQTCTTYCTDLRVIWTTGITEIPTTGGALKDCLGHKRRKPLKTQISSQLLRCVKNFLLTYIRYAAPRNFLRALHLGELWIFRGFLNYFPYLGNTK